MSAEPEQANSLRGFCRKILESGDLTSKLASPPAELEAPGCGDWRIGSPLHYDGPIRDPELAMSSGSGKLPAPGALRNREARVLCLARFAHHELMAVELFAWALLRWPELPEELQRGLIRTLAEEQLHCRLYMGRLNALGSQLSEHRHSDYFWRHAAAIAESPHGPRAFLAAMGLTLEQANLDFTLLYRDAFREAGDESSARVCQRVHDDEIRHVKLAAQWLSRLSDPELDPTAAYESAVPFPLAASRAKGRRFDVPARQKAGLDAAFIEHVRVAKSSQQSGHPDGRKSGPLAKAP